MKELTKMTKAELIDYINAHEVHAVPTLLSGMTMGLMCFLDRIAQYLLNIKTSNSNSWVHGCMFYNITVKDNNDVVLTFKSGGHSISTADYLAENERKATETTALALAKHVAETADCHGCPGPDAVECDIQPKHCLKRPSIVKFEY